MTADQARRKLERLIEQARNGTLDLPKTPKESVLNVRVDKATKRGLTRIAASLKVTVGEVARQALSVYVETWGEKR